jgi:predicted DNA-binding transcriptional regulator YafY
MIDIERMYKYMDLLEGKRFITASEFITMMEISHATFKRDLAVLRDRFDVPIVYDRDFGAYKIDKNYNRKQIPGIWFSPDEITVIQTICEQLAQINDPSLTPSLEKIHLKFKRLNTYH